MSFLTGAQAVQVFLCFAFAYLLSYAFRSVNAVIAPALQGDLGLLSSAYFVSIAAHARWAPRRVSHDGSRGLSTTRAITFGLLGMILAQAAILSCPPVSWAWTLWIVLAFFVTVSTLIQSSVSLSFPTALAGRASSAYNFMVFVGAFIVQWGMSVLIDVFQSLGASPPQAMRAAFALCVGCQTLSPLAFSMYRAEPAKVPDFGL